jgi:hypothetical protein
MQGNGIVPSFSSHGRSGYLTDESPTSGEAVNFEKPDRTVRFSHTSPIYLDLATPAPAIEDAKFSRMDRSRTSLL